MFRRFLEKVGDALGADDGPAEPEDRDAALRLATSVLMVEVARADHDFDGSEFDALLQLLADHFDLSAEDATALAEHADETATDLVSLHDFTRLLNENLSHAEKGQVVALLWRVAYADGRLDRYEDALVLKISDLLYVKRARAMRLKHDASTFGAN